MGNDYIIWLGYSFSEQAMLANRAVSPAANRWQKGLINGLAANGETIQIIGHMPEPIWPRGRFRMTCDAETESNAEFRGISYLNIPFIRHISLANSYIRMIERLIASFGKPKAIVAYNALHWNVAACEHIKRKHGVPWVCLVADVSDVPREFRKYEANIAKADALVFLSHHLFEKEINKKKLHLDGGCEKLKFALDNFEEETPKRALIFTGSMDKWSGVRLLLKAFRMLPDADLQLWLCGKDFADEDGDLASDSRIKYFGCVSEERLAELTMQASVLVNPRPPQILSNAYNYPSKVMEYLSYGKPVVSTWTAGLAPEYRDVLIVCDEATPESLAEAISNALQMDEPARQENARRIYDFVTGSRTWANQGRMLKDFINSLCSH